MHTNFFCRKYRKGRCILEGNVIGRSAVQISVHRTAIMNYCSWFSSVDTGKFRVSTLKLDTTTYYHIPSYLFITHNRLVIRRCILCATNGDVKSTALCSAFCVRDRVTLSPLCCHGCGRVWFVSDVMAGVSMLNGLPRLR